MSWFKKLLPKISTSVKKGVPEGVWSKCKNCTAILYSEELYKNQQVCPKCNFHMPITARERLGLFFDASKGLGKKIVPEEIGADILPVDQLKFRDSKKYKDRLVAAQKKTGEKEALIVMCGKINGLQVVVACFDFNFIAGSMSNAVGQRFVAGVDHAISLKLPFICFSTSGGARMQEGLISLMQMSKTSAVLARLASYKLPYISILTDPTMGGVSASLATLGDIIIAEPKALIGFSGPRVIQQTIREVLPEGFQRSEFLLEHGAIDMIVDRREMKDKVSGLLAKLTHENIKRS